MSYDLPNSLKEGTLIVFDVCRSDLQQILAGTQSEWEFVLVRLLGTAEIMSYSWVTVFQRVL